MKPAHRHAPRTRAVNFGSRESTGENHQALSGVLDSKRRAAAPSQHECSRHISGTSTILIFSQVTLKRAVMITHLFCSPAELGGPRVRASTASIQLSLHHAAQRLTARRDRSNTRTITQLYYFVILTIVGTHHQLFLRFERNLFGPWGPTDLRTPLFISVLAAVEFHVRGRLIT